MSRVFTYLRNNRRSQLILHNILVHSLYCTWLQRIVRAITNAILIYTREYLWDFKGVNLMLLFTRMLLFI